MFSQIGAEIVPGNGLIQEISHCTVADTAEMKPQRVGIREVAGKAGVSFSTAAAALRGESWVRPETRSRVEKAASALNYKKDAVASILASRRSRPATSANYSVAYVSGLFPSRAPGLLVERLPTLDALARSRGFQFERIELRDPAHARQVQRRLLATGVEGILVGPVETDAFLEAFPVDDFSVVGDQRSLVGIGIDTVRPDPFNALQRLLRLCQGRGLRRMLVLLRCHTPIHGDDRARFGAVVAFAEFESQFERLQIHRAPFRRPELDIRAAHQLEVETLAAWLREGRYDGMIGFNVRDHVLLIEASRVAGLPTPAFAAMSVRAAEVGRIAGTASDQDVLSGPLLDRLTEKLRSRIRGLSRSPIEVVVSLPFIDGPSLQSGSPEPAAR